MNRENKLALIIGFTLILVVGVLVSDHLSRANNAALEEEVADVTTHRPISGGTIQETIAANITPRTAAELTQQAEGLAQPDPVVTNPAVQNTFALTDPNPIVIDQGKLASNQNGGGPGTLDRLANSAGNTLDRILDIYSHSAVPAAVELDRSGPRQTITEPTSTIPTSVSYEVKAGDNIYRIAERYLGNGERWPEIRDANPGVVGDEGELAVGVKLKIRVLEPVSARVASTPPTSSTSPASGPTPVRPPMTDSPRVIDIGDGAFRTYEVKPGDILGKIAQKELGTVKRMDEILRLNADKLKDADSIRVGMKIKLPAK